MLQNAELIANLDKWLSSTFNDLYLVREKEVGGAGHVIRLVNHAPHSIHRNFISLLGQWYPKEVAFLESDDEKFVFVTDSTHVTIECYDNRVHHTLFIKEETK